MRTANTFVEFGRDEGKTIEDAYASAGAKPQPARVAVIEDDERLRQALVFQLGTADFHVVPYNSAEEFFSRSPTQAALIVS